MASVLHIFIYPIKSTKAISINSSLVETKGLQFDRRWMIVDENGKFMTQRHYPQIGAIKCTPSIDKIDLDLPEMGQKSVSVSQTFSQETAVQIWQDIVEVNTAPEEINDWISQFLGTKCKLVYMTDRVNRQVDLEYGEDGEFVSFADGFPLLLTSHQSLVELNERISEPVSHFNFRPNIVIDGVDAFEEDRHKGVRIGDVKFKIVKPCARCVIVNLNPETGEKLNIDLLRALSEYRQFENKIYWGQNVTPIENGVIKLGDSVEFFD